MDLKRPRPAWAVLKPLLMPLLAPLNSEPAPTLQSVEVSTSLQLPSFQIIGLPSPEIAEARERVRAAIDASGLDFPRRRVVVNLSPAHIRKRGTGLDLPMALAILSERDEFPGQAWVAWAELGLDGRLKGAGHAMRTLYAAWNAGVSRVIFAEECLDEFVEALETLGVSGIFSSSPPHLYPAANLKEAWDFFQENTPILPRLPRPHGVDFREESISDRATHLLPLPPSLERVIGLSAAGNHHLLLLGPRGTGKSHALEWLKAIQLPLSPEMRVRKRLLEELQNRSPSTSSAPARRISSQVRPGALLGRANALAVQPGEFSAAHGGLLIADELPEWSRDARESLREPLERGWVTLTRVDGSVELPARFTLAANGNLCPCGGWPAHLPFPLSFAERSTAAKPLRCRCTPALKMQYLRRLSGPILDRIDLVLMVNGASSKNRDQGTASAQALRSQVLQTRERMIRCWGSACGQLDAATLEELIQQSPDWSRILQEMTMVSKISLRGRHKILRLALSLAAWDGSIEPGPEHFAEAACYRPERFGLLD